TGGGAFMGSVLVGLVDSHPVMIAGLAHLFAAHSEYDIVATGTSSDDVLSIADRHRPRIIVLDIGICGDAFAAISRIAARHPQTSVIVYTAATGVDYAVQAL